jgi:hypothetical protein
MKEAREYRWHLAVGKGMGTDSLLEFPKACISAST